MSTIGRMAGVVCVLLAGGCASLEPKYGCPAPDGISCMSISEVSERDDQGLPMRRSPAERTENPVRKRPSSPFESGREPQARPSLAAGASAIPGPRPVSAGDPLFRPPRLLRVWVVDWEDHHQVYHPNHYLYIRVDDGGWRLPVIRENLAGEEVYEH